MRDKINIVVHNKVKIDKKILKNILEKLIKEKIKKRKTVLSLIVVNSKIIKELNKRFRRKDKEASVLSFPLISSSKFITPGKEIFLGDIIINIDKIKKENKDLKKVIKENLVHAFLHLLLYRHDTKEEYKKMAKEEEKLLGVLNDI